MSDLDDALGTALHKMASVADGFATPTTGAIAARVERQQRGQRLRVGVATALLVGVIGVGGVVVLNDDSPVVPPDVTEVPTSDDTLPTSVLPATTTGVSTATTRPVPTTAVLPDDPSLQMTDVAVLPDADIVGWTDFEPRPWSRSELFRGGVSPDGTPRHLLVQSALRAGECPNYADIQSVYGRCTDTAQVTLSGQGIDRDEMWRLLAASTDEVPSRLDTTGTDLVSLGRWADGSAFVEANYSIGGDGFVSLQTTVDKRPADVVDFLEALRPSGTVFVDVNGVPATVQPVPGTGAVVVEWRPRGEVLVRMNHSGPVEAAVATAREVELRPLDAVRATVPPEYGGPGGGRYTPSTMDPRKTAGMTAPSVVPVPVGTVGDVTERLELRPTGAMVSAASGGTVVVDPPLPGRRPVTAADDLLPAVRSGPYAAMFGTNGTDLAALRFGTFTPTGVPASPTGDTLAPAEPIAVWVVAFPGVTGRGCIGCPPTVTYRVVVVRDDDPSQVVAMLATDRPAFT